MIFGSVLDFLSGLSKVAFWGGMELVFDVHVLMRIQKALPTLDQLRLVRCLAVRKRRVDVRPRRTSERDCIAMQRLPLAHLISSGMGGGDGVDQWSCGWVARQAERKQAYEGA